MDYYCLSRDMTIDLASGEMVTDDKKRDDWTVHLVDTGLQTQTGGRVRRLRSLLKDETFMVTYGDGVSSIDLCALLDFHKAHGRVATITAVRPPARFGGLEFEGDRVARFTEKPQIGEGWINGGFMVFEPGIFDYLHDDSASLEAHGLEALAADRQLMAYKHADFWQCMDTLRDKLLLERLWQQDNAAWKVWSDNDA
jgi:glucose-1-phosphate cytidylyltransferase